MQVADWKDVEDVKIEKFPFKGEMRDVIGVSVRWLSKFGDDGNGYPEYGLRFFTIQPGGQIPIHNHFYHQTMFILEGQFECWSFDAESEEVTESCVVNAGESVFIPSMDAHGMKNLSDKPSTFLCCICNVYEDQGV